VIAFFMTPLGKLAGIAMLAVALLGAGAVWLHTHDNSVRAEMQAQADKAIAAAQAVDAEHEKAAVAAVASDAQKRAVVFTSIKDQTHAAPTSSACAASPGSSTRSTRARTAARRFTLWREL
jgi:acyl-CoA synthetase (AMP-forming)/AMP-acid ligase II